MGFTKAQQAVIDARNSNVLVSAAAGSGKTTVLVERIIQKITGENSVDIDRLLVVTFTKAAASQMKEKILNAIQARLLEEPENAHLQRQETLVHGAQIATIHSFCQYVIRNNFNEIDLDPSYRVGDDGEMKLLRADVLEEVLEEKYAEASEDFLNCTEYFSTGNNDKKLEKIILQLYDYAMSMPFPEEWLMERASDYRLEEEEFENVFFVSECKKHAADVMNECVQRLGMALQIANEPDGPYFYGDLLEREKDTISGLCDISGLSYNEIRSRLLNISFDRLPGKKDPSVNTDKRDASKKHRDYVKEQITKLIKNYFVNDKATIIKHMALASRPVEVLAELAILFKQKFDEKKRELGIIDFGDMEHLALKILIKKNEDGSYEPTPAAMQYRDYYDEIMIDEYQDSNNVQELLLSSVSGEADGRFNRFMVGDVKQSIYKFRLARPEIFMEKMANYSFDDDASKRKITLHNNFRSRREVLDSVNFIFEQIMGPDLGGVRYDEDAALRTGAQYPEPLDNHEFATELLLVNRAGMSSDAGKEVEARMTALRINELMKNGRVSDDKGGFRAVRYSDIVILLRATSGWDDIYKKALEERGIPTYVDSKTGYFSTLEVVTVLNVLNVLNNPLLDIPLVSVMHSPIGGFTDEELAIIKANDRKCKKEILEGDHFFEILERSSLPESELSLELAGKIDSFLKLIEELREQSEYLPIDELINRIFDATKYYEYCASLPGGERRIANLNLLVEKASDYEKTSFKGLFHFVRYIEQLSKYQVDFGEAGILDEHADVVRIMSIHKSKGLEFPVVFVAGMSKEFNIMDITQDVVCDMDLGVGTHAIDLDRRIKYKTLRKSIMNDMMFMDILGEELRILYVAMTRAKEKLILAGQIVIADERRPADDITNKLYNLMRFRNREALEDIQPYLLPYFQRSSAKSYLELILMALIRHPDIYKLTEKLGMDCEEVPPQNAIPVTADEGNGLPVTFEIRIVSDEELEGDIIASDAAGNMRLKELDSLLSGDEKDQIRFFDDRFSEEYRYSAYSKLFVKTTVSELKKAGMEEEFEPSAKLIEEEREIPVFMSEGKGALQGAERGTAYHKIMELLYEGSFEDYENRVSDISGFIQASEESGRLSHGASKSVKVEDIISFVSSSLGVRMAKAFKAGFLHRESPFMMGVSAVRLDQSLPEDEMVLVQGIIDVWFEEDGDIVLLDYKTDRVKDMEELVKRYKVQLDYYDEALNTITEKKVKERLIYSFTLGEYINV